MLGYSSSQFIKSNSLNAHYAKGKQIEVTSHKQSHWILQNKFKLMANKHNNIFHNSEYFTVKSFNGDYGTDK